MRKRIFTLALAMVMILQTMTPVAGLAKGFTPKQKNMVKVGDVDIKSYPQPSLKTIQEANRRKKLQSQGGIIPGGARLFSSPYFPGQDPADDKKPLIYANVNAVFSTKGLDGGNFDWEGVFGKDQDGKPNKAQIVFEQIDNDTSTRTGVKFFLKVGQDGTYTWSDDQGKPTKLPLYSNELKPFKYEVLLDEDVTDHVKLLTARFFGTEEKYYFGEPDPVTGEIVGEINLDLTLQQVASTKFTSKWNTGVEEANRPTVEGSFLPGNETDPEMYGIFKFPSNDTEKTIIRNDQLDPNNPGEYSEYRARDLEKTPKVDVADPDPDSTDTYTIDRDNNKISYNGKTYKYQVDYDVINGGKLTMTEILPVTFDANGGKFANFTAPDTETKIVKEVEYDGTLTDKAESPTKDRETFKGWGIKDQASGKLTPVKDADYQSIKAAKTFYAIWDNNEIVAKELEVKESFKDGTKYVNDFIPTLDQLKGQVTIKDANGVPQPLETTDTLTVLDDSGNPIAADALKDALYDKLKEDPNTEVSRVVTLKAKLTRKDGVVQEVTIPIKVIKNIYESKTEEGKPNYVPDDYVKVTVDPTTKAEKPQQYFYYVNPAAKVVIPGEDPTGTGDNQFAKWLIKGTTTEYKLADKPRHQFDGETTIEAQYVSNVIPGNPDGSKPDTVPNNYVKVSFVLFPEKGGKIADDAITVYYVSPEKEVTIPQPKTIADIGYEFGKWEKDTTKADKYDKETTIKGSFERRDSIIPATNDDGTSNNKPDGYVTVTFTDGMQGKVHGKITSGKTVYYVNPKANKQLKHLVFESHNSANRPIVTPDVGYKFTGWLQGNEYNIVKDVTVPAEYKPIADVISQEKEDGTKNEKPKGYFTVKLIPTDKAKDAKEKIYFVNPTKEVTITNKPVGTEIKDANDVTYKYTFNGWTVTRGTIASWNDENIKGTFSQDTEITAKYSTKVDIGTLIPAPVPKKDAVTPKGDTPDASTLIENKDKLPNGTTFKYTDDGKPDVNNPGKTTAKVEVRYPNGKTVVVEVPITVVDNVVPQTGKDKPNVPDNYVKVNFEIEGEGGKIADDATTIYYVNPEKVVTIDPPQTNADTGYVFDKWDKDTKTPAKYTDETTIKGNFTKGKDIIPATNEDGSKNEKPDGYVTLTFDKGDHGKEITGQKVYYVNPKADPAKTLGDTSIVKPSVKAETGYKFTAWDTKDDFEIKDNKTVVAQYEAIDDVVPKDNPQGGENEKSEGYITVTFKTTEKGGNVEKVVYINPNKAVKLEGYAPEVKPITGYDFAGWDRAVNEKVQYTEDTVITAKFNEKGDVIPQENPDGSDKPAGYLTVTFDKGAHGELSGKTVYYVNPNKEVTVPAPTVIPGTDYVFDKWDQSLTQKFTAENTTITAEYKEIPYNPSVDAEYVLTEIGKQPTVVDYAKVIHVSGGTGTVLRIVEQPDVSSKGMKTAKVEVEITNGSKTTKKIVEVPVFVKPDPEIIEKPYPVPGDCNNSCDQPNKPNQPNQPNIGMDALNTTDHYQYLIGYPNGNFAPNRGMTRAEVATMFTRLLRERPVKGQRYYTGFSDIQDGDWYANTVGYAVQVGIVSGYPDGSFKPNKPITRAEFASIASRFDALAQGNNIAFNDLAPSHWGYNAIRSAATKGWISGYPDNTFRPEKAISRAEVTSITNRMLNRYADLYWIDAYRGEVIRFGDVKRGDWYFEPIMEATMGHDFIRDRDGKTEHWTGLNGKSFI